MNTPEFGSILESMNGLGQFCLYFGSALVFLLLFKFLYPLFTPHKEWQLLKEGRNSAAATAFSGAFVGFSIALGGAISNSVTYADFIVWGLVALLAQVFAFVMVFVLLPGFSQRIQAQELSAGIFAAGTSIAVGVLNAASMTY